MPESQLKMKFVLSPLAIVPLTLTASIFAHEGHSDSDQMPLGYIKYPYQAMYPGDNTGTYLLNEFLNSY